MAKNQDRIELQIGISADKTGFEQMQSMFQQLANKAKEPGDKISEGLRKAGETAATLDKILDKTFNSDLGTLNVSKFNQELKKCGLTLNDVKNNLAAGGNLGATAYNKLSQAIMGTNQQLRQSNKLLDYMAKSFKNVISWGVASSIFNTVTNSIKNAYVYTKQLDTSLNNIRIVTDKSADSMAQFAEQANSAAKSLGASTLDYSNAALIYYQQGLSDKEAQARAETTVKAANITGQTGEAVSEQLTAVWNGYKVTAEETELYVDKLAAVAATTASDLEELSTGMSKVASAANAMGVDFDDLNAQMSTIISVTRQAPESVGTALKTIYARLGDLKVDGVDEFGVKLGEVTSNLKAMGIEILDQQGNMRDMSSVITEVAEKWQYWTEAQKQAAAIAMAGKRQYNNLIALFENWDMYSEALETSADAMGTLQHQQDIYMESTAAKLKTLKATTQDLYEGLIDTDEINAGIDALTNLVQVFDNFVDSFNGGFNSFLAFGAILTNLFSKQLAKGITNLLQPISTLKSNLDLATTKYNQIYLGVQQAENSTPVDKGAAANAEDQYKTAKAIFAVRQGINDEQAKELVGLQQAKAELVEQKTIVEEKLKATESEVLGEEKVDEYLNMEVSALEEELNDKRQVLETSQEQLIAAEELLESETEKLQTEEHLDKAEKDILALIEKENKTAVDYKKTKQEILKIVEGEEGLVKQELVDSLKSANNKEKIAEATKNIKRSVEATNSARQRGLATQKGIVQSAQEQVKAEDANVQAQQAQVNSTEKIYQSKLSLYDILQKIKNKEIEIETILSAAKTGANVTKVVTATTTALSTMAMAWSTVSSLMQTLEDKEASTSDKIMQTFMTLGMVIPMMTGALVKLNTTFGYTTGFMATFEAMQKRNTAATALSTLGIKTQTGALWKKKVQEAEDAVILRLLTEEERKKIASGEMNIATITAERRATLLDVNAKKAEVIELQKLKAANDAARASMLLNPLTLLVTAVIAVVGAFSLYEQHQKKIIEAEIEEKDAIIEKNKAIQEEVKAMKESYDSFKDLYSQYKEGKIEKQELYDVTDKLCEVYNIENGYLAKLTGNYDELNDKIDKTRENELETAKVAAERAKVASEQKLFPTLKKDEKKKSYINKNDGYGIGFNVSANAVLGEQEGMRNLAAQRAFISYLNDKLANGEKILDEYGNEIESVEAFFGSVTKGKDVYEQYKIVNEALDAVKEQFGDIAFEGEVGSIAEAQKFISDYQEHIQGIDDQDTQIEEFTLQQIGIGFNSKTIDNIGDYRMAISEVREELQEFYGNDEEKIEAALDRIVDNSKSRFAQLQRGLDDLLGSGKMSEKEFSKFQKWSEKDLEIVFSGQIDLEDPNITEENVRKQVDLINKKNQEEDLSIVVSLRAKIASDKKLSKKDLEEMIGEENALAEDYDVELYDFENGTKLEQVDTLNEILNRKVYVNRLREQKEEEKEILQENLNDYEKRKQELEKKLQNGGYATNPKEQQRLKEELESTKEHISEITGEIGILEDELKSGGLADELNHTVFDKLINGMDGVILKAQVLSDIAGQVGENWTIASKDIEEFSLQFADILSNQENYNILQDGSLQLTEKGKAAYQEQMEVKKQELIAENAAYKLELQRQADIHEANAQYYKKRAERLKAYLRGETTAAETAAGLEEDLTKYKLKLAKAVGQGDAKLTKQVQQNLNNTRDITRQDCQDEWDYYCSVGGACLEASLVGETGEFNPPPSPNELHYASKKTNVNVNKSATTELEDFPDLESWLEETKENNPEVLDAAIAEAEKYLKEEKHMADKARSEMVSSDVMLQSALAQMENAGKGKDKSGKDKKGKDLINPEIDYFHKYKKIIEETEDELKRLGKVKDSLRGKNLIKALNRENKLLEKQRKQYEKLNTAILEGPKTRDRKKTDIDSAGREKYLLTQAGAKYDDYGYISNYAKLQKDLRDEYNAKILLNRDGALSDEELEKAEQYYNEMIKIMKSYEDHVKELYDNQEKMEEQRLQEIDNNLKKLQTKIQLKHDKQDFKRQELELQKSLDDNIQSSHKDYMLEIDYQVGIGKTYKKDLDADQLLIDQAAADMKSFEEGGVGTYFKTYDEAKEAYQEGLSKQLEDSKNLKQSYEDAWNAYLDGIDQAISEHEELYKEYDRIEDELEHMGQLIDLVWGEEAYDLKDTLYENQHKASLNRMASLKNDAETYEKLFKKRLDETHHDINDMTTWDEDEKKYYEQWQEAQANLRDEVEKDIQIIKDKYDNAIEGTLRKLEKEITGSSLEDIESEWEQITKQSDKYYDDVEKAYEIQTLANKWDKEIASTKEVKAQQKLKKLRDEEIKKLREKDKLTEYDLKKAELRYQLELKQMALEDARNNKTSMKLTRNAEGNWSYQYVANEDDIKDKQQEYYDTWHDLYELSSDEYKKNLEEIQDLESWHQNTLKKLAEKRSKNLIDPDEYEKQLNKHNEEYYKRYNELAEENAKYREDLNIHATGVIMATYQQDVKSYEGMTEDEKKLVDGLKDYAITTYGDIGTAIEENLGGIGDKAKKVVEEAQPLDSLAQKLIDKWAGDKGKTVKNATEAAAAALLEADRQYIQSLKDIETQSGETFFGNGKTGKIGLIDAMNTLGKKTTAVRKKLKALNKSMKTKLPKMATKVGKLKGSWVDTAGGIQTNIDKLKEFKGIYDSLKDKTIKITEEICKIEYTVKKDDGSGSGDGNGDPYTTDPLETESNLKIGKKKARSKYEYVKHGEGYRIRVRDSYMDNLQKNNQEQYQREISSTEYKTQLAYENLLANPHASQEQIQRATSELKKSEYYISSNEKKVLNEWAKKYGYDAFATGGYTGAWGEDGRLAILHQKELVLNADDTENFLSGISMIRDMSSLNGSINNSILKAISNMMMSLTGIDTGLISGATTDNSSSNTTFNITAEFPNAENVNDIREAILSLPNLASQFKGQRLK